VLIREVQSAFPKTGSGDQLKISSFHSSRTAIEAWQDAKASFAALADGFDVAHPRPLSAFA
jgi:hypothetical protein